MQRIMLKSKIHQATVTEADLYYEGSLTIDEDLMETADIIQHEKVSVVNINNGARFETYVIPGQRGSGVIGLNGAAARLGTKGDKVIIMSYCSVDEHELKEHIPNVVLLGENNQVKKTNYIEMHGSTN
jgi:aspartate 1-decarboxylase